MAKKAVSKKTSQRKARPTPKHGIAESHEHFVEGGDNTFEDERQVEMWPEERNIFIRPERLKYVRKIDKPKGCVFCDAATTKDRKKKLVLYRSKNAMVLLNKYPYNNGHILIMPMAHEGHLENLKDKVYDEIQQLLKHAVVILKKVYKCGGLNVGLNLGADAGAGIPDHLHYHVIPRWYGDTNFFPLIAKTKLVMETPETTFKNLHKPFAALEGKI